MRPLESMDATSFLPLITATSVVGLLACEWRGARLGVWLFKPLAAASFVLYALAWGALDSPYGLAVLAGLLLGACGDVLLIPRERERVFLAGVAAFGASHLAYLGAFALRGVAWAPTAAVGVVAAGIAWPVWRWLSPRVGDLRPVVRG